MNNRPQEMPPDPDNTPKFGKPPVIETVLGVQFKTLPKLRITHYGLFWQAIDGQQHYPFVEERPPLPQEIEHKDDMRDQAIFQAWITELVQMPRVWYLGTESKFGQRLIQFQPDRFLHNWRRKSTESEDYPPYKQYRKEFELLYGKLAEFAKAHALGVIEANQCEVTYINRIPIQPGESYGSACLRCFRGLAIPVFEFVEGAPERLTLGWSHWIEHLRGRLSVVINPAKLKETGQPVIDLRITARGAPGEAGVLNWLDYGHYYVVNSFASMTTEEMHKVWLRER